MMQRLLRAALHGLALWGLSLSLNLGLGLAANPARAADPYPSRPITVVVPYPAGGVVDVQTRIVVERMAKVMGAVFVVDNKPGANANIAAEYVARAQPDGHTLLVSAPYLLNNPLIDKTLRWALRDFDPVARFALSPSYFVVPVTSPATSVRAFADLARRAKPPLQYADAGRGTTQTMSNETFAIEAGIPLDPVPYKGAPPYIPDLITGALAMAITPSTVALPQIRAGKLRALAVISSHRSPQLPDVPTIAEAGYPQSTALSWYALHAPAGTPAEVIRKLEVAMDAAVATPEVKDRLSTAGGEPGFLGHAAFKAFLKGDAEHWQEIVRLIKP